MKRFTIALTDQQFAVIDAALQNVAFKIAAPILADLHKQINDVRAAESKRAGEEATQAVNGHAEQAVA